MLVDLAAGGAMAVCPIVLLYPHFFRAGLRAFVKRPEPLSAFDAVFLIGVLPCACLPALACHGFGGAWLVYLWVAHFWRESPQAPASGLASLGLVYMCASAAGLFEPLMTISILELLPLLVGVVALGECSPRASFPFIALLLLLQLSQRYEYTLWAHAAENGLLSWCTYMRCSSRCLGTQGDELTSQATASSSSLAPPPQLLTLIDGVFVPM